MSMYLDNKKVYIIIGIVIILCVILYILPNKNASKQQMIAVPLVNVEPRFFNKEIYDLPNGKADPYILYGSQFPSNLNMPIKPGFERLLPIVENLPKISPMQCVVMTNV